MNLRLGVTFAIGAGLAFSQANAENSAGAADQELTEITVTGSRVISNGNDSPTPVTVISPDQMLKVMPTTVVDTVNLMPALQGSQSTTSNPGGGQRNGAAAYVNLRDMGDLRTLVLLDGHRVIPTINQNEANVDSWVIPQMLIQRVDVVTGGVAAVYGSDAVSGVVNFITDTKLDGVKVQASTGVSTYHDDEITDVGIAAGTKLFGNRGHIEFSYEYHDDPGIGVQADRPWFAMAVGGANTGTAASPYYNLPNQRIATTAFGGLIKSGPLNGYEFAQNGVVQPFVHGALTTAETGAACANPLPSGAVPAPGPLAAGCSVNGIESGGDGAWYSTASIKSALIFSQLFGRFDYDVTDDTHAYLQLAGTHNHTQDAFRSPLFSVNIGYNNPYLSSIQQPYQAQLQAQAALTPTGSFSFSKLIGVPATADQHTDTYMLMGGLDGSIGKYKWNVGVEQATSQILAQNQAQYDMGRFYAAVNTVVSPTGQITCRAAALNPNYADCVPLNLFGPSSESAAALAYITHPTWNLNHTTLTDFDASITGSPVSTWAGPVNMALSAEWREIAWSVSSNGGPNDLADCNGVQFSCTQGTTTRWLQNTMPGLPRVAQIVSEAAYETDVPLLKDLPLVQQLNLNAAVRYTDYTTSGSVWTWKAGLDWHLSDDVTLRATRSRDIRAPNLFELYSPTTVAPTTLNDPLTGKSGSVPIATVSNSHLTPEKADSLTGGVVFRPHFIPGFSLAVDAFRIRVNNAVSQLSGISAATLALCDATAGANSACATIIRPLPYSNTTQANFPTLLLNQYLNIASFYTYGVDLEANWATHALGHPLTLRALASYQPHLIFNQGPAGIIDLGDAAGGVSLYPATPSFKYTVIAQYDFTEDFNVSIMERGRNSMKVISVTQGLPAPVFMHPYDPSIAYTNLNLSYHLHPSLGSTEIYLNIQNLFNRQPSQYFAGANSSPGVGLGGFFPPAGDDIVGRYYMLGVRFRS
jgi:outer membrane receptor protein involved in Fe transport